MEQKVIKQEKIHLQSTLEKLRNAKAFLEKTMEALGSENISDLKEMRTDPETSSADYMMRIQQLHEKNEAFNIKDKIKRLDELDYSLDEPYFARIDLEDRELGDQSLYIGKFGFTDEKPVITDWRAKVSSIYYRYRFPQKNVKYTAPDGEIVQDLKLKRTYEISNGELVKYFNNDLQLDESEIIAEKIGTRTGGVLEDIVATIQESQLDIIEADPRSMCIVQGCVGSGKSTVAIHKLSHILFNFPELVQPERAILVAKSGVLVSYLSTLFPKLGIFDINYKTLRELVYNLTFREEIKYPVNLDEDTDISEITLKDVKALQKDLAQIHETFSKKLVKLVSQEDFSSLASFVFNPKQSIIENINELIEDLNEELFFQKEKLKDNPKSVKSWIHKENISNIRKLISKLQLIKKEARDKVMPTLCKKWKVDLSKTLGYKSTLLYVYIHSEIIGFGSKTLKYQYCVVDEGQDFNVLEYLVLGKLVMNDRFCILGDLNQSILEEGLTDWDLIKQVVSEKDKTHLFLLETNYRSTKQIIDFANKILKPYTKTYLPKSINRVGKDIVELSFNSNEELINHFDVAVRHDLSDFNKSIGVVVFDMELFEATKKLFEKYTKEFATEEKKVIVLDEHRRVHYVPVGLYLSKFEDCKGLEFAKVYVLGMSPTKVSNYQEAKKAFVASTRAMNELEVYSTK